jgi:hypothetical protein
LQLTSAGGNKNKFRHSPPGGGGDHISAFGPKRYFSLLQQCLWPPVDERTLQYLYGVRAMPFDTKPAKMIFYAIL